MVVAAYPLAKIGLLLMKQLSKPVANIIKNEAKRHPKIRKFVIVPIGRAFNWAENQTLRHVKGSKSETMQVTEEEAVELGSNAIGEIVLFGLLTIILLAEYNRQGDKKAVKEKTKEEELINLQDAVIELINDVEDLKKSVKIIRLEIETASDVIELEEQRHAQIHDHNFWDILSGPRRNSTGLDKSSPSV